MQFLTEQHFSLKNESNSGSDIFQLTLILPQSIQNCNSVGLKLLLKKTLTDDKPTINYLVYY